jgi:hypothetical protein
MPVYRSEWQLFLNTHAAKYWIRQQAYCWPFLEIREKRSSQSYWYISCCSCDARSLELLLLGSEEDASSQPLWLGQPLLCVSSKWCVRTETSTSCVRCTACCVVGICVHSGQCPNSRLMMSMSFDIQMTYTYHLIPKENVWKFLSFCHVL